MIIRDHLVEWKPLQSREISFLQSLDSLYVFDLRGTNVLTSLKIPDFWKYENVFPWILEGQHVVVNEDHLRLTYPTTNDFIVARKDDDPRVSLIERLALDELRSFSKIWMGIPDPAADSVAQENNIPINFPFSDFQNYNDKYTQKEIFDDLTPEWKKAHSESGITSYIGENSEWFLKRRHGSGGWHVLDLALATVEDINIAFSRSADWFLEKRLSGNVYSVQCVRLPKEGKTIIFGFVNQLMESGTHFVGGRILPLSDMETLIKNQLEQAINKLEKLLKGYEGFYGIDFIITDKEKLYVLEANVRMTAMTIPVLIANNLNKQLDLLEDVPITKIAENDMVIAEDLVRNAADILRTSG
jgi:hypothetical protein